MVSPGVGDEVHCFEVDGELADDRVMKALHTSGRVGRRRVAPTGSGAGRDPYDRELSDLVGELSTRSELFAQCRQCRQPRW